MSTPPSFARHKQHPRHSTARSLDPYRSEDALERLGPAGPDKDSSVSMSTASDSTAFPWHMTHASPPVEGAQHDKQVIPAHRAAADACRVKAQRERIHPLGLP
ncbi:unnamed protein product [Tilletia controversa]|uniref:Uncharacterized protein n=3 Tax=Tilletia TaxID=13289 RepID=A0A9N8LHD6_9BASI